MNKMNELATSLDDLTSVATKLKMCAQELITISVRLHDAISVSNNEVPILKASEESTPQPAPEPQHNQPEPQYTKESIRALLSDLAANGHREEAKDLVQKYANGGSFSDINPARYPELAEEVHRINA